MLVNFIEAACSAWLKREKEPEAGQKEVVKPKKAVFLCSPFFFPPLRYWASNRKWLGCLPWNRWLILCHAGPAVDPPLPHPSHSTYLAFVLHCVSHPHTGPGPFRQLDIAVLMADHTALPGRSTTQHDNSHITARVEALSSDDATQP